MAKIEDLTQEEYDATYGEGEPHSIPPDVLKQAIEDAKKIGAQE